MKILHVTLGNPLTHQGGLNRYCLEVSEIQRKMGNQVYILYPGTFSTKGKIRISNVGVNMYRIYNALPVAITYGIDEPLRYMKKCDSNIYVNWLKEITPDIIHVHSIQGIHKEFFEAAKNLGIKMCFTTHDYYPVCFKTVLYANGTVCSGFEASKCAICNENAGLNKKKQQLMQSEFYQRLKGKKIVQLLKKKKIKNQTDVNIKKTIRGELDKKKYSDLHKYYIDILMMMNIIHCNSENTYNYYKNNFGVCNYKIIPITHMGLLRSKHIRMNKDQINISYMGGATEHKGYGIVEKVIDDLERLDIPNWKINYYGSDYYKENTEHRNYNGYFNKNESESVWKNTDVLIAPSQCPETFGYIILEAIARGIPVIASDLYGSSFLLKKYSKYFIFSHNNENELKEKIKFLLNADNYGFACELINSISVEIDMEKHVEKIMNMYIE